MDLFLLT